jgi:hypothetical protein
MRRRTFLDSSKVEMALIFSARRAAGMSAREAGRDLPHPWQTLVRWQLKYVGSLFTYNNNQLSQEIDAAGKHSAAAREIIAQKDAAQRNSHLSGRS